MSKCDNELCNCKDEIDFKENERMLLLSKLMEAVEYLFKKAVKGGNIRDERKEKIRVQYFRTLAYSCSIYNQISRDNELDELKNDITELRELMETRE
jgi:hypothetical protein